MRLSQLYLLITFCSSSKHWATPIKLILGVRNRSFQHLRLPSEKNFDYFPFLGFGATNSK